MTIFSDQERAALVAIAEAAMPAGKVFGGAGPPAVARVEQFIGGLPNAAQLGYRALIRTFDGLAWLRHRHRLPSLALSLRLELLEQWRHTGVVRRNALQALLVPLKVAHFDDPSFYRHLGCVYQFDQPAVEVKPGWFRERVHSTLDVDRAIEVDVVVIGTGAGGAVVAKELAEAGVAVAMLEEGAYFDRSDFSGRAVEMQQRMYRAGGATFSVGNVVIPIPLGQTVGGSTTVNSGTCYRAPPRVFATWRSEFGLDEMTVDHLAPYYDRVEEILGVAPTPPAILGGCARVVARGAEALGYRHLPLRRNAPGCDGKGVCCFGCPTDAKRSTNVSYVPMALKAGAELYTCVRAERILIESGRAVGVVARTRSGRSLTVRARAVVVACGTLLTPILLMRNRLADSSDQLGANLSIHPACGVLAEMTERVASWQGVPQGYAIEEFADQGLMFEGAATPLELTVSLMPHVGPRLIEIAEGYDHIASFGLMVADTSRGRVRLIRGRPVVTYSVNDTDLARLRRGIEILSRVYFAAGARVVLPPVHGFDELRGEADLVRLRNATISASDLSLSAYHPLGTARMGPDPRSSVVDPNHQVHGTPGLYVIDGSSVPSALGVNPQLTIMALATRAADRLAARL